LCCHPLGSPSPQGGKVSPVVHEETVMKEALLNVVTDPKLMVLIVVVSQVIALAKAIA